MYISHLQMMAIQNRKVEEMMENRGEERELWSPVGVLQSGIQRLRKLLMGRESDESCLTEPSANLELLEAEMDCDAECWAA